MATVDELIADARAFVDDQTYLVENQLRNVVADMSNVYPGYDSVVYIAAPPPQPPPPDNTGLTSPEFEVVPLELPPDPEEPPEFQDINPNTPGDPPEFTDEPPEFDFPSKPSQGDEFTEDPPAVNTDIEFPSAPDALVNPNFSPPQLSPRSANPIAPEKIVVSFEGVEPVDTSVAPTDLDRTMIGAYTEQSEIILAKISGYVDDQLAKLNPQFATQMAAIETQLTRYMAGGTGLSVAVETAIFDRARERNDLEAARLRDAAYAEAASRGFTLPTGAVMSTIARARQEASNLNAKAATDIAVAQAELEQKNLQFAVTTSISLRNVVINATLAYMQSLVTVNGQALDYAKALVSTLVENYNVQVKVFSTKVEAYKASAAVYETKLRGVLALVDIYKAELQILEMDLTRNKLEIDIYNAEIGTLNILANVYRSQVEATKGQAELEKLKIEIYQAQVQAYSAAVQGKNAEWQGYTAAISGEEAKSKQFNSQVEVFNSRVLAYKTGIEAKTEEVRAISITNDARARQYSALLGAYEAQVRGKVAVASGNIDNQRQRLTGFEAEVRLAVADAQIRGEYYKYTADTNLQNAKYAYEASVKSGELLRDYGVTVTRLNASVNNVYAQVSSAALAGMNTLASRSAAE